MTLILAGQVAVAEGVAMRWAMVSHSEYVAVAGVAAGVPWSAAVLSASFPRGGLAR